MAHEIIMALLGCPGDLIQQSYTEAGEVHYAVNTRFPFFTTGEREAINQVIALGAAYASIVNFVEFEELEEEPGVEDHVLQRNAECRGTKPLDGLYIRGVKNGIGEILTEYRSLISSIESDILSDPARPIAYLRFKLHAMNMHHILPALAQLVSTITRRRLHGAHLLETLFEGAASGPVSVSACLNRVSSHCYAVLFNLVASWTLYGRVFDPYQEFFVARGDSEPSRPNDWEQPREEEWNTSFVLRLKALPLSIIPSSLAQQIMFIGKAVRTLRWCIHNFLE